jgi:ATP-binding cassette, subfamily B, bacterial
VAKRQFIYAGFGLCFIAFMIFGSLLFKPTIEKQYWTDVIRQTDGSSCGVASLQMIFKKYGIEADNDEMRKATLDKDNGSSLLQLKKYAETKGLISVGWKYDADNLENANMPCIVLFDDVHFVVLDSIKRDFFYIRDPLQGKVNLSRDEFLNKWDGITLTFEIPKIE